MISTKTRHAGGEDEVASALDRIHNLCHDYTNAETVCKEYGTVSDIYEKDMTLANYSGPQVGANTIKEYLGGMHNPRILDIAAGTGMVGKLMRKDGFTNLHAVDGSQEMLDKAKAEGIYNKYICSFVTDQPTPGLKENMYDGLITVGSFIVGHLQSNVIQEFIRLVKPGGYIVIVMREEFLRIVPELTKLEPTMREHELRGDWKQVEKRIFPKYVNQKQGMLFVYQIRDDKE